MMVLTFVLSQCFIVKLLTKPILLQIDLNTSFNLPFSGICFLLDNMQPSMQTLAPSSCHLAGEVALSAHAHESAIMQRYLNK